MHSKTLRIFLLIVLTTFWLAGCDKDDSRWALGTLERDRIILKTTASEIIVSEPVAEGQQVKQGTLIVQLDDRRQRAKVARAEAELAKAKALFEKLRHGARIEDIDVARSRVDGAQAVLTAAEKDYRRTRQLLQKGLISQGVLDKALATRDSAAANLKATKEQLQILTKGTRKEDIDQAEANVNAAQAQLDLELYVLSELSIKATRDGYLDSLPWNKGERVTAGSNVAILLADASPYARVYVPEPFRVKLKLGDKLKVKVDGLDKTFDGRLRWISSSPSFTPYFALNEADRSRLVYVAEVEISAGEALPTGIPAQVLLP
ncbi:MAG TPA: HlyD family efflux transporter periplasmic adaptor subunit [Aeromonadales bacterium]|nr:HlyD family efflux transporter periplasmic adaptor subunit [Aeromonadales bacterium]